MKKTMMLIAIFAAVVVSLSAHTERVYEAANGFSAPVVSIAKGDSIVTVADFKGHYTLLNFWSSADPSTRISAQRYDAFASGLNHSANFSLLSVNMDVADCLYREIVRRDGLNEASQYHVDGAEVDRLVNAYNMRHGLRSFLIDPTGRIIAVDPSTETLTAIIKS